MPQTGFGKLSTLNLLKPRQVVLEDAEETGSDTASRGFGKLHGAQKLDLCCAC